MRVRTPQGGFVEHKVSGPNCDFGYYDEVGFVYITNGEEQIMAQRNDVLSITLV